MCFHHRKSEVKTKTHFRIKVVLHEVLIIQGISVSQPNSLTCLCHTIQAKRSIMFLNSMIAAKMLCFCATSRKTVCHTLQGLRSETNMHRHFSRYFCSRGSTSAGSKQNRLLVGDPESFSKKEAP